MRARTSLRRDTVYENEGATIQENVSRSDEEKLPARPPDFVCARCKSANNLTQDHVVELWIASATFPGGPHRARASNFFNGAANLQTLCL
jgi:hypothetical protein